MASVYRIKFVDVWSYGPSDEEENVLASSLEEAIGKIKKARPVGFKEQEIGDDDKPVKGKFYVRKRLTIESGAKVCDIDLL
jgi:hypothetical protein